MSTQHNQTSRPSRRHESEERALGAPGGAAGSGETPQGERKPSPIKHQGWRGEGVVGDRHTD